MFKKLVANLPFSPGLISQVGFYADRLKQEKSIRRLSFLFITFTMVIQMVVVAAPPERSVSASSNHIINGLSTKQDVITAWDQAGSDVPAIYGAFGVTRDDLLAMSAKKVTIDTREQNYWSIGRNSLTGYSGPNDEYKDNEVAISYKTNGSSVPNFFFQRELRAWDVTYSYNQYRAFRGTIKLTNKPFWILLDCGNLTTTEKHRPIPLPTPAPAPTPAPTQPTPTPDPTGVIWCSGMTQTSYIVNYRYNTNSSTELFFYIDKDPVAVGTSGSGSKKFTTTPGTNTTHYFRAGTYSSSPLSYDTCRTLNIPTPTPEPEPEPIPEPVKPELKIIKSIVGSPTSLSPGDTFTYQIEYRNTAGNSLAEDVEITDDLDTKYFDIVGSSPVGVKVENGYLSFNEGGLYSINSYEVITIEARLKDQISSGTNVCNTARITASNANADDEEVCVGIITPCPFDEKINDNNPNCIEPKLVCSVVASDINRTTKKATFKTIVTSTNPTNTTMKRYSYDYGDEKTQDFDSDKLTHETSHTYAPGEYELQTTIHFRTLGQTESNDKSVDCISQIDFEEDETLGRSKTVKNITQEKEGSAAIKSSVKGNDIIEYTLTTTNSQDYDRVNVDILDYIGDILDYATVDQDFLKEQGGVFNDQSNKIVWSNMTVPANSSLETIFRVKIKSPIPSTNSPSNVSTGFDCKISNEYGNEITMSISCPLVKGLESLPNTGPGSSIVMMSGVTVVVGYFFARSQLLAKEIDMIRRDYVATGGA